MRILDLFCGAGGAGMGYARAGFEVVGVDIDPQPHYPFAFVQADALAYIDALLADDESGSAAFPFDAIHASPPCQAFTAARRFSAGQEHRREHPNLIPATRDRLEASGLPYVIENVPGAPIRADLTLCGTMLGLELRRHRWFESNIDLGWPPFACSCRRGPRSGTLLNVYKQIDRRAYLERTGLSMRDAMAYAWDIDWMATTHELSESIPPAYTQLIGGRLMEHLYARAM